MVQSREKFLYHEGKESLITKDSLPDNKMSSIIQPEQKWHVSSIEKVDEKTMKKQQKQKPHMARVVERNITALLQHRKEEEAKKPLEAKIADGITRFSGSMLFVYLHLALFGSWILWNAGALGLKPFDPSFVILAMTASVEAIFLSTFVLISQNRMNAQADKRAELDLQISLLSEHEITRLITLVNAIAKKLDITTTNEAEIEELSQDVYPERVMETMDKVTKAQE